VTSAIGGAPSAVHLCLPPFPVPSSAAVAGDGNNASGYTGPDADRIRTMFGAIARRYDRANALLSAGVHHRWRRQAVLRSGAKEGDRVLDCATGTGDLAISFRNTVGNSGEVVGTDFTPEMIELARAKDPRIRFEVADVMSLPFSDAGFDISSISFGIRNVSDPRRAVSELARVVRSGGCVVVLEFGQPRNRVFRTLYDLYSRHILPRLGGVVTGERAAYEYLERSAGRFPCGAEFLALMRESASFATIDYAPLTFGIAYLYVGVKA
jgi:demethylmenaquinone methyltransferase / 2-methoxy-6-polyprenyl-1,4-benzoquinol methylase